MALRIAQLEEVQALLLTSPALIKKYEARSPGFLDEVNAWLVEAERVLESNRIHVVSRIAQLRALLLSSRRGLRHPSIQIEGRVTRRKLADTAAIRALGDSCDLINDAIAHRTAEIAEAQKIVRQTVSIARAKGLTTGSFHGASRQQHLTHLRSRIAADSDLAPYYVALVGIVTPDDALVLIDRSIHSLEVEAAGGVP